MDVIKIGKLIAKIRKEKKLTQEELGSRLGISGKSVSKWERGINAPDISLLQQLSDELGISVNELLCGVRDDKYEDSIDNNITIKGILYYYNKLKHKNIIIIIILLVAFSFIFTLIFTINNFNRYSIYSIGSEDSELMIEGFIIFNQIDKMIIINDIKYYDQYEKTEYEIKAKNVDIELLSGDKVILYLFYEDDYIELKSLSSILDDVSLSIIDRNDNSQNIITKNELDNLFLLINYDNETDNRRHLKYKLNYQREFTNNKLFY